MKKILSILIIMILLGNNLIVYAEEKNDSLKEETVEFTLQDYYNYNDSKSGVEVYSLQKDKIKEEIYNGLINFKTQIDITSYMGNVSNDMESIYEVVYLYFDVLNEYPEIFYASNAIGSTWGTDPKTNKISYMKLNINYLYDKKTAISMQNKLNEKVKYIENNYLKGVTDKLQKEYIIHDYIINNTKYDYENYIIGKTPQVDHTAYGALINGVAVCEGYARAAVLLFKKAGIEAGIVTSSSMSHAWNYVNINNNYYHVDLTWDDPVPETNRVRYDYFNLTNTEISKDHYGWNSKIYPTFSESSLSDLRNLASSQYNNISRIDKRLYYIEQGVLYSCDLYGKNKKTEVYLGYSYMPVAYGNSIIFVESSNHFTDTVKKYNLKSKEISSICDVKRGILELYIKNGIIYIQYANELKKIEIKERYDLNNDGVIDIKDIANIAIKYNLNSTSNQWNKDYDLNNDNIIDIFDLVLLSKKIS